MILRLARFSSVRQPTRSLPQILGQLVSIIGECVLNIPTHNVHLPFSPSNSLYSVLTACSWIWSLDSIELYAAPAFSELQAHGPGRMQAGMKVVLGWAFSWLLLLQWSPLWPAESFVLHHFQQLSYLRLMVLSWEQRSIPGGMRKCRVCFLVIIMTYSWHVVISGGQRCYIFATHTILWYGET